MTGEIVVIDRRFRGPLDSGHGGYTCGLLAREIPGAATVSLHVPPPLERQLTLELVGDGLILLCDGEVIVADARPATLVFDPPPAVALSDAQNAALGTGPARHPFPMCFGCGPEREPGDGLRLFPGPVDGRNVIACPWRPDMALADENGRVRTEFVWAALDFRPAGLASAPDTRSCLGNSPAGSRGRSTRASSTSSPRGASAATDASNILAARSQQVTASCSPDRRRCGSN